MFLLNIRVLPPSLYSSEKAHPPYPKGMELWGLTVGIVTLGSNHQAEDQNQNRAVDHSVLGHTEKIKLFDFISHTVQVILLNTTALP